MTTERRDYIERAKKRAVAELETSGRTAAIASMMSDIMKYEGSEPIMDPIALQTLFADAAHTRNTGEEMRKWIDGF